MINNYLKIAYRNLSKHKGYAFVSIFGLSVGMACCIIIMLWVRQELNFDRFHSSAEKIFRVETIYAEDIPTPRTVAPLAPALLEMAVVKFEAGEFLSARAYLERFQQVGKHNPASLWLAVQTEFALRDHIASGKYAVLLRENYPKSEQAVMLLEWESEHRSGR